MANFRTWTLTADDDALKTGDCLQLKADQSFDDWQPGDAMRVLFPDGMLGHGELQAHGDGWRMELVPRATRAGVEVPAQRWNLQLVAEASGQVSLSPA